jgi:hypothetical protein
MPLLKLLLLGFIAGFLSTLIFHQGLWYLLNQIDLIPPERPAWPLDSIPPFGVPYVISKAFWGGLWGAGVALLLEPLTGATYWTTWIHRRRGGANSRCALRRAADQGRAHPGAVAARAGGASLHRALASAQPSLRVFRRAASLGGCSWRRNRPSGGRRRLRSTQTHSTSKRACSRSRTRRRSPRR